MRETFGDQQNPTLDRRLDLMFVTVGRVLPSVRFSVGAHTRGDSSRAHACSRGCFDRDKNVIPRVDWGSLAAEDVAAHATLNPGCFQAT